MSVPAPITEANPQLQRSNPGEPGGLPNEAGVQGREFLVHEGDKVVPKIITRDVIVEVPQIRIEEIIIEKKKEIIQEKIVEVPGPEEIVEVIREIPRPVYVDKVVEIPEIKYDYYDVEKIVEVPQYKYEYVEKLIDIPVEVPQYHEVEKTVEVPMVQYVQRDIPAPFVNYHTRDKEINVNVQCPRAVQVEKWVDHEVEPGQSPPPNCVEIQVPVPQPTGPKNFVGSITARVNQKPVAEIPMSSQMAYELNMKAQQAMQAQMQQYSVQFDQANYQILQQAKIASHTAVNQQQQMEFEKMQAEAERQVQQIRMSAQQSQQQLAQSSYGGASNMQHNMQNKQKDEGKEQYQLHEAFYAPIAGGEQAIQFAQRGQTFQIGQNLHGRVGQQVGEAYPLSQQQIEELKRQYGSSGQPSYPVMPGTTIPNQDGSSQGVATFQTQSQFKSTQGGQQQWSQKTAYA